MGRIAPIEKGSSSSGGLPRRGGGGFALLSPAFLDELRDRTSLSGLIGRTVKLQRAGNEHKACCPFHNEKSPSFYVNDDKGFYHCFGCGAHGDAIRFLTEAQGLSFLDAVRQLVDAAGMEMPAPDPAQQEKAERASSLHEVTEAAARWFSQQLQGIEGAAARAYLERRGFEPETQAAFSIGFAPDSRGKLKSALASFGGEKLIEAGLLISVEEKEPYDRFRGRLMIPIRDPRGKVIAFGGRIIGEGEPKYLNSPDTPLFDKGRTLFNLDRAGAAARRSGRVIVVEGYLDVMALDQAGITEAVAPLGTALTEHQMERLWRLVDHPLLCFDGDGAGRKAAVRAAQRALPMLRPGKSLLFATLPPGEDPDDIVRRGGAAAFEQAIAEPEPLERLLYRHELAQGDMARPEMRARLRARLDELAQSCADRIVADEYRRSFNALFFEDFGWKKDDRRTIASAIIKTGRNAKADLRHRYARSMLYGLARFPQVLAQRMEEISRIRIDHPELLRWRDSMIDAVIHDPTLDGDAIEAILEATNLPEVLRQELTYDLRFAFTQDGTEADQAVQQLEGLVVMLSEERELDEELATLDKAAVADADGERYEAIESARQGVRQRRFALRERGYQIGAGELND